MFKTADRVLGVHGFVRQFSVLLMLQMRHGLSHTGNSPTQHVGKFQFTASSIVS
jgi:hypothetical protein